MEINVGDYVRTKFDEIGRVIELCGKNCCGKLYKLDIKEQLYSEGNIIKHSEDIIKVLEKGDICIDYNDDLYVVDYIYNYYVFTTTKINKTTIKTLVDYQIKMVLTKQQFEANAYTIEKER